MRLLRARPNYTAAEAEEHNAAILGLLTGRPKIKRRAKRVDRERPIHIAIVRYLEAVLPRHFIVHHSRNGGLSKAENGKAKAMGAKLGWLDIVILGERDHGLLTPVPGPSVWFLEVKAEGGSLSSEQRRFMKKLDRLGIKHRVVRSIDDVRAALIEWDLPSREVR